MRETPKQKKYFNVYSPAQEYFSLQKNFPCLIHHEALQKNVDAYTLFVEENFNTEDSKDLKYHIDNFNNCLREICKNGEYSTHGFHQSDRYILDAPEAVSNKAKIVLDHLEKFTIENVLNK